MAKGYAISSQVITFALQIALPVLVGAWLDRRWGTKPLLLVLGLLIGFGFGMLSFIQFLKKMMADSVDSNHKGAERDDDKTA